MKKWGSEEWVGPNIVAKGVPSSTLISPIYGEPIVKIRTNSTKQLEIQISSLTTEPLLSLNSTIGTISQEAMATIQPFRR